VSHTFVRTYGLATGKRFAAIFRAAWTWGFAKALTMKDLWDNRFKSLGTKLTLSDVNECAFDEAVPMAEG